MFKLGFPVWYGYGGRVSELIREAKKTGFDYLEVSLDYPWPFKGSFQLSEVVKTALSEGLLISFHAPWRDLRFSSPFQDIRRASLEVFEKVVSEISRYESDYLVVHLSTDQAADRIEEIRDEVLDAALNSVDYLKRISESFGLRLVVENVREDLEMFKRIALRASRICLDVGHVIISTVRRLGKERVDEELERWLDALKDRIEILHYSGVRFEGKWIRDHQLTDSSDKYLKYIKKKLREVKLRGLLLEVFEGGGEDEHVRPSQLAEAVSFLKKA